ncbi:Inositol-1,4,5-trisphosphate 5-phosphatase 1 [Rhodosporidiobolus nylandii]
MATLLQLLLIPSPSRTLALASPDFVLLFRQPPASAASAERQDAVSVVVEFLPRDEAQLEGAVVLNGRVGGCLGMLAVGGETFLAIITQSTTLGTSYSRTLSGIGCEPISRILSVDFFCLTSAAFDYLHAPSASFPLEHSEYLDDPSSVSYSGAGGGAAGGSLRGQEPTPLEHPCQSIRKILSNGAFYFSSGPDAFDLSTRLQERVGKLSRAAAGSDSPASGDGGAEDGYAEAELDHDARFLWNTYLVSPLLSFRGTLGPEARQVFDEQFMVLAIQGFAGRMEVNVGGKPAVLSLISRLGWKRSGTRFNVRGVDDDGEAANFVETETILRTADLVFSYVQTRGSVPLFWEEGGGQPFAPKITITRPIEASLPAFTKHFEDMLENYSGVHVINLLGAKEGESALTSAYTAHLSAAASLSPDLAPPKLEYTAFDFHARAKLGGIESLRAQLAREVGEAQEAFGACVVGVEGHGQAGEEGGERPVEVMKQRGVVRTNCKDCLDRTNATQDSLSRFALEHFLSNTQDRWAGSDTALWTSHRILWADNGDALSKSYTGTGAINTSFTRTGKKSLAGMLSDATKSVSRVYQQQFVDSGKQKAIDALLGNLATSRRVRIHNPVHDLLRSQLRERQAEYTSYEMVSVWVGTYNLNGKPPGGESLLPWLFPVDEPDPAFLVVAFQEIVPLSPQQIMSTDPEKKRRWEQHILDTLASRSSEKKSDYVFLRSGQLVGTALIVLVKKELAGEVRNVEAATKKTGLKGMAGNKGAVAIRLDFRSTSFCFLTAHLAAGHSNVEERNQDYFTIASGLHFSRGRTIDGHDNIVWAADTNYRISLPNEEARGLAEADAYSELYEADQLNLARRTRGVLPGYEEAAILFRPTYKYDNGTDTYDTSEKARIPAYTDRILYKGRGADLDAFRYQRAELMASDHRPVYALFRARIRSVDEPKRAALRKQLLQELMHHAPDEKLDEKLARLAMGGKGEKELPGLLPPPSSDEKSWWEEDGKSTSTFSNPFDLPPPSASSASSSLKQRRAPPAVPRKAVPPPAAPISTGDLLNLSEEPLPSSSSSSFPPPSAFQAVRRKPIPSFAPRSESPTSLRSLDASTGSAASTPAKQPPPVPRRPPQQSGSSAAAPSLSLLDEQPTGESWTDIGR